MLYVHLSILKLISLKFISLIKELTLIYLVYLRIDGMTSSILICYKYNKPIRNTIFNFNYIVSDLDIHANTSES